MIDLEKIYNPKVVEKKWYQAWVKKKYFSPELDSDSTTFTIMIPPPNVTGVLHMGHVLNNTIQDIFIRKARMQQHNTLWLPGTDHASIATEAKVTKMLKKNNTPKKEIGREKFLEHAWKWKEKYGGIIIEQLKSLGASCDWEQETFTMDKEYSLAVQECFVRLYKDGYIYKGERIINWDPVGLTALSDEEVIYKESKGHLWHFKYRIKGSNDYIIVATTRPETMLGDTGVAVHPKDKRYSHLIGKKVLLPIVNREIPIFSDDYVDKEFGTGCVKVTPAHDINDFAMGERNHLEIINIMNPNASLNQNVPKQYIGLDRFAARKKVVSELEKLDLVDKIEDYTHSIGHSERTDAIIEPYLSNQWFVKMTDLAAPALKVVKDKKIKFYPERWTKTYYHWMENIQDWCISRQLWWGHRIPIWYRGDEVYCGINPPEGEGWVQDEDVLDTWFSSWLWPFATLGWPNKNHKLKQFYPTQDLVTGPDIIFFWVARMIMAGLYFMKEIPFSNVYFTGIIRDDQGRKMSKSLGNSPDPLDLIEQYGADAIRVSILMIAPQGLDILYSESRLEQGRNFMNKLWNSARFILLNIKEEKIIHQSIEINLETIDNDVDYWILSRLNKTIDEVDKSYKSYRINECIKKIYEFTWRDFCDWYIELSKTKLYGQNESDREKVLEISIYIIRNILKLLHPFAPYITEELWGYFKAPSESLIIIESWPKSNTKHINDTAEKNVILIQNIITSIRNIRSSLNVSPKQYASLFIRGEKNKLSIINSLKEYIQELGKIDAIKSDPGLEKPKQSATAVVDQLELFIPLEGLIDLNKELNRLEGEITKMQGRLNAVNSKLNNKNFVDKAPAMVVNNEKTKQAKYEDSLNKLKENYNSLK